MKRLEVQRLKQLVMMASENKLEDLRNQFSVSDIEIHIKSLMIELIDYRLNKNRYLKAALIENSELNYGDLETI